MKSKTKNKLPELTKPAKAPAPTKKLARGFAVMSKEATRKIASMGGTAISRNRRHMAKIGSIGGANSHKLTNGRKARAEA